MVATEPESLANILKQAVTAAIDEAVAKVPDEWMDPAHKATFCARLKTTRHSVAEQIRAKYPAS